MDVRGYFLKKRKFCMPNLTKERKHPPVVILQQAIFYNTFILRLWLRIIRRSDQGVQFINFPSQIFFNDINLGYRAAILKKNSPWLLPFYKAVAAIMNRCAEQCALLLYRTSLSTDCSMRGKLKEGLQSQNTSLIAFGETLSTLVSSKSSKSHDIDIKFYSRKNYILSNKNVSEILIKHFHSQVMNILLEVLNNKMSEKSFFFCNKIKTEVFLENRGHTF